jgi:hypothetical protein
LPEPPIFSYGGSSRGSAGVALGVSSSDILFYPLYLKSTSVLKDECASPSNFLSCLVCLFLDNRKIQPQLLSRKKDRTKLKTNPIIFKISFKRNIISPK